MKSLRVRRRNPGRVEPCEPSGSVVPQHDGAEDDDETMARRGFCPCEAAVGGRAEVTMAGKGRTGSNAFLGGVGGPKKQQAFVLITWPGGSASRTVKGNMTIRLVMEWCAEFNAECERLSAADHLAPGESAAKARDGTRDTQVVYTFHAVGHDGTRTEPAVFSAEATAMSYAEAAARAALQWTWGEDGNSVSAEIGRGDVHRPPRRGSLTSRIAGPGRGRWY